MKTSSLRITRQKDLVRVTCEDVFGIEFEMTQYKGGKVEVYTDADKDGIMEFDGYLDELATAYTPVQQRETFPRRYALMLVQAWLAAGGPYVAVAGLPLGADCI